MDNVEELIKTFGARVVYDDKWLVWDDKAWSVFGKKKYKKNTVHIGSRIKLSEAINLLITSW